MREVVLALSQGSVAAEFATRLAVDAGLDVIKVEAPAGDPLRRRPGHLFDFLAAGKRSVVLDMPAEAGMLPALLARCDAVLVDPWGASLVGEREGGPPVVRVGERDSTLLADGVNGGDEFLDFHASGLGYLTPRMMPGYPSRAPLCPQAHLVAFMTGLYGAIALFAALVARRTGVPASSASVGIVSSVLPLLRRELASVFYGGDVPHRNERIWKVSPAEMHRCRDGWVFVDIIEDEQWVRLCRFIGRPDLAEAPGYATREARFANAEAACALLDAFFATQDQSCWEEAQAQGVPIAPVNAVGDLLADRQLEARGFWTEISTPHGRMRAPRTPIARSFDAAGAEGDHAHPVGEQHRLDPFGDRGDMKGPLNGVRILELTHVWSGPLCGQILADLGAEVIRIENRARLDIHRRGGPYAEGQPGINRSGTWNAQNRGKLGCTLNLKVPEGRELFLDLVAQSQVVIENFTPGTLSRLGVGFDRLSRANARIVLLSLSGFGQDGPLRDSLAYGPMMDAAIGMSALTTYGDGIPRAVNGWAADVGGALYGGAAVVRALLEGPERSVHLDVSQFESGVLFATEVLLAGAARVPPPQGDDVTAVAESGEPERFVAVAARTAEQIEALGRLLGAPTQGKVGRHAELLESALRCWAAGLRQAEALAALRAAGVPAAPVSTVPDLLDDPGLKGRWIETEHPEVGQMRSYGPPIQLAGGPANRRPAPCLGQHNDYVFGKLLGLGAARLRKLEADGVL